MKYLYYAIVLWPLAGLGCVGNQQEITKGWNVAAPAPLPPPPVVTANQVNQENAHQASQALWDEMDRQAQNELLNQANSKTPPSKN